MGKPRRSIRTLVISSPDREPKILSEDILYSIDRNGRVEQTRLRSYEEGVRHLMEDIESYVLENPEGEGKDLTIQRLNSSGRI